MKVLTIMFLFTISCFGEPVHGDSLTARIVMGTTEGGIASKQQVFVPNLMVFTDGSFLRIRTTSIARTTKSGNGLTYSNRYSVECGILPVEEMQLLFNQIERMGHNMKHIKKLLSEANSKVTSYKSPKFVFISLPGLCSEGMLLKSRSLSTLSKSVLELKFLRTLYSTLNENKGKETCSRKFLSRRIARILVRVEEMQTRVSVEDKKPAELSTLPFLPLGTDAWHSFDSEEQKSKLMSCIISGKEALVRHENRTYALEIAFLPSNLFGNNPPATRPNAPVNKK
ncbi:MAG: hypothetical protein GXO70_07880 [Acidobacteria bacterium]|nr:hypothetical protein [Acidobacteriota bacterium]